MSFPVIPVAYALAELAPSLKKWFGSKSADKLTNKNKALDIANKVVDIARTITGEHNPNLATDILKRDPKLLLQFQRTVADFERDMVESEVADRASARERDIQMMALGRRNTRADIMVISAAMGLASCLVSLGMFSQDLPGEAVGIISTIAGIFGACLKDAYSFEFGSSRGSKEKDLANIKL